MIGIVDYRMGNLRSVQKALAKLGHDAVYVRDAGGIERAEKLILPGVGAFGDAMGYLREQRIVEPIRRFCESGRPFLGICLGLQLIFDRSSEDGDHEGLGIVPGRVVRFEDRDAAIRIPHMGWNKLTIRQTDCPLFADLPEEPYVYFVHSYYARPAREADMAATTDYPGPICAAVGCGQVWATQFHPEKSQRVGLKILENFAQL